jgi:hypothetical protein
MMVWTVAIVSTSMQAKIKVNSKISFIDFAQAKVVRVRIR